MRISDWSSDVCSSDLYLIAFVGDLPGVPRTVDHGPMADRITAFIVDLGLIGLFGLQHTIMARQGFKRGWTAIVPKPVERSVYVQIGRASCRERGGQYV